MKCSSDAAAWEATAVAFSAAMAVADLAFSAATAAATAAATSAGDAPAPLLTAAARVLGVRARFGMAAETRG
jgi:hypothetical protein